MSERIFEPASVQYDDWKGTVALDDPDRDERLYELAGLDPDEWSIVGISLGGGRVGEGDLASVAIVYAVHQAHGGSFEELVDRGRLPVIEKEIEGEGAALELLEHVFKRWQIRAMRSGLHDAGVVLEIVDND